MSPTADLSVGFARPSSSDLTVVWFDPGAWTGWAIVRVNPMYVNPAFAGEDPSLTEHISAWNCGTFDGMPMDNMDEILKLCIRWAGAVIGTEDFTLQGKHLAGRESVSPIGINYALEFMLYRMGRRLWYQMPGVKDNFPPSRLRMAGFWREGMGTKKGVHGQEALSHAINWLKEAPSTPAYLEALASLPS